MLKKTKTTLVVGKKFNSVFLAWVLSLLAIPTIISLVPAFFDQETGGYADNGEVVWYYVWSDITKLVVVYLFFSLVLSYAISLIMSKDSINNVSIKKINKSAFIIATIINVAFAVGILIYSYFLPLIGIN